MLRVGGPAVYDHWVSHDLHFDSDVVRRAGRLLGDALLTAGAVQGGPVGAAHSDISFAVHPMFDDPPGCLMMVLDSGLLAAFPTSAHLGEDIDYFVLPPVDGPAPAPVLGGGVSAAAMSDRPEVRALMGFFAGKQWGATGASQARNPLIPPRVDLQVGTCVNSGETLAANALRVRLCQDARDALAERSVALRRLGPDAHSYWRRRLVRSRRSIRARHVGLPVRRSEQPRTGPPRNRRRVAQLIRASTESARRHATFRPRLLRAAGSSGRGSTGGRRRGARSARTPRWRRGWRSEFPMAPRRRRPSCWWAGCTAIGLPPRR